MGKVKTVETRSSDSRAVWLWLAAIFLVAIFIYVPSLSGDFCLDDDLIIVDNPTAHGLQHLPEAFRTHFLQGFIGAESLYYRPLITASFQLDYSLWGLDPHYFRLTNLLLYLICTALVFVLARKLTQSVPVAGLSGLIFTVLPSHTESAAWICGRTDIIAVIFMLGSLLFFIKNTERAEGYSWKLASASAVLFMAGLFSKEAAAITPLLFVAYAFFFRKQVSRNDVLKWLALIVPVCLVYAAMRYSVIGNTFDGQTGGLVAGKLIKIGLAYALYLRTLFLPTEPILYSNTYAMDAASHMPIVIAAWLAPLALIALVVFSSKRLPVVAFSATWILVGLILQTELIPAAGLLKPAERFVYTASVGSSILLGWLFRRLYELRPKSVRVMPIAVVVIGATYILNGMFMSVVGLQARRSNLDWAHYVARQKPNYWIFRASAAQFLSDAGDIESAVREYESVLDCGTMSSKDMSQFSYKLGLLYAQLEDMEGAQRTFGYAVKADPTFGKAWRNLARAQFLQGQFDKAVSTYEKAFTLLEPDAGGHFELGHVYKNLGQKENAAREFRAVIAADPASDQAKEADKELKSLLQ